MSSYLEVVNVSKSYGPRVLFDHISFHIDEGDKIALVAPNGTGKTSTAEHHSRQGLIGRGRRGSFPERH